MARPVEQRFPRTSAVGRYWLARCEGFRALSGSRPVGTVEEVRCASWHGEAYSLVVKGHGRRATVAVERVLEIDPWSETVVLAPSRKLSNQLSRSATAATKVSLVSATAARAGARRARRYGPVVAERSRVAGTAAARGSQQAMSWSAPRLRRTALVTTRASGATARTIAAACILLLTVVAEGLVWLRPRIKNIMLACGVRLRQAGRRIAHLAQTARERIADRAASSRRTV